MTSKQIPAEKPDIVKALTKISERLEILSNEQDETIYLKTSSCYSFIEDAIRGNYEISFGDIIRELKVSVPGFGEDIRRKCVQLLHIAQSIDDKIQSGEVAANNEIKILRAGILQLIDDIDFVAKKLRENKKPKNLITLTVAVANFNVSRATLNRAIDDNRLKSYPQSDNAAANAALLVDAVQVAKLWPTRN